MDLQRRVNGGGGERAVEAPVENPVFSTFSRRADTRVFHRRVRKQMPGPQVQSTYLTCINRRIPHQAVALPPPHSGNQLRQSPVFHSYPQAGIHVESHKRLQQIHAANSAQHTAHSAHSKLSAAHSTQRTHKTQRIKMPAMSPTSVMTTGTTPIKMTAGSTHTPKGITR